MLRGTPDALEALVPVEGRVQRITDARIEGCEFRRARVDPVADGLAQWTVSVDERMPPGKYEAVFRAGGQVTEVLLVVEPVRDVEIDPTHIVETICPGDKTNVTLTIVNRGNVDLEIPEAHVFGLFQSGGLEAAAAKAYASKQKGLDRLAVGIEGLAERHALVRTKIDRKAPVVTSPGAFLRVTATIKWPGDLTPGHTYHGTWAIGPARLSVRIDVAQREGVK